VAILPLRPWTVTGISWYRNSKKKAIHIAELGEFAKVGKGDWRMRKRVAGDAPPEHTVIEGRRIKKKGSTERRKEQENDTLR